MLSSARARWRGPTARGCSARPAHRRERAGWSATDWNGFNVLHRAAARVGGLDLGFVPGAGGRDVAGIVAGCRSGDDRGAVSARRRRDRSARHRLGLCDLPGPSRRPRRARAPMSCCRAAAYTEKDGDLRQYRGPGAARPPRGVPARRGARGLGDPAGAVGRARPAAAVRFAAELAPADAGRASASWPHRRDRAGRMGRFRRDRGRSTRRPSSIRSPISTAPTRSAAPARRWPSAARLFGGAARNQPRTGTHG